MQLTHQAQEEATQLTDVASPQNPLMNKVKIIRFYDPF